MKYQILLVVLLLFGLVTGTFAQDDNTCSEIVEEALSQVADVCAETGRNEACYGNDAVLAIGADDEALPDFEAVGDIVSVVDIESLQMSVLDEESATWGISVMQVQANLPDTIPGQNVTFLLFGDVEITDASTETTADGMTYGAMQAFYFRTGIQGTSCFEGPTDGIIIETPQGVGTIDLLVNEVQISLGSTLFLQAEAGAEMIVNVLEGEAEVTAFDTTVTVEAGFQTTIPLDANGAAAGEPTEPQPYNEETIATLPTITTDESGAITEIGTSAATISEGLMPISGEWTLTVAVSLFTGECNSYDEGGTIQITATETGVIVVGDSDFGGRREWPRMEDGSYLIHEFEDDDYGLIQVYFVFTEVSDNEMQAIVMQNLGPLYPDLFVTSCLEFRR